MPNIKLKGQTGEVLTYEDVERVYFDSADKDGEVVYYTHGKVVEDVTIEPDFSDGDQVITVPDGSLVKEATIIKPAALVPENIRAGTNVAGVVGELIGDTEEVTVDLDMAEGGQVITPSAPTKVLSKVVVTKPGTMLPENIKAGVDIGGVVGEYVTPGTTKEIEPDFSDGDYAVTAEGDERWNEVVVKMPETLIPENIAKDVDIGGVVGNLTAEGTTKEIEPDFSEGDHVVTAGEDELWDEVVVKQPAALVPGNIAEGVTIAGVLGNAPLSDFDSSDENLKYLSYHLDIANKEVIVRNASMYARYKDTGINAIVIPNRLGGYKVAIEGEYSRRDTMSSSLFGNSYLQELNIGKEVRYVNGNMANLVHSANNMNNPIHIPNGVTNLAYSVYQCNTFNQPIDIPNSVVNMTSAFGQCRNLNQPITIPNSVISIASAFYNCRNLNSPIVIGSGVQNAVSAFNNCINLSGNIVIYAKNANTTYMLSNHNNTFPLNIFVYAGSNTENSLRSNRLVISGQLTWVDDATNHCFYNTNTNIRVYNNL